MTTDTLRLLGVADLALDEKIETGVPTPKPQVALKPIVIEDDNDLWRTITSTSSSGDTFDTSIDMFSDTMALSYEHRRYSCGELLAPTPRQYPMEPTDAIGRSLVTGLSPTVLTTSYMNPLTMPMSGSRYDNAIPILEDEWWGKCEEPLKTEAIQDLVKCELVDLTMLD